MMIQVSGFVDDLLIDERYKDIISDKEETMLSMIDCPILKDNRPIGVINDIDMEEGMWYGVLWGNVSIGISSLRKNYIASFNIVEEGSDKN